MALQRSSLLSVGAMAPRPREARWTSARQRYSARPLHPRADQDGPRADMACNYLEPHRVRKYGTAWSNVAAQDLSDRGPLLVIHVRFNRCCSGVINVLAGSISDSACRYAPRIVTCAA